jgi:hypothetical protein
MMRRIVAGSRYLSAVAIAGILIATMALLVYGALTYFIGQQTKKAKANDDE